MSMRGIVYLVGAGSGDPGLLTMRGAELLGRADLVIYDGLVNPSLLQLAKPNAEIICASKHDRLNRISQSELNALMVAKARAAKCVVRLKGGDPYTFGRGGEEAATLAQAGIAFEVVPGVSSVQAVPAYAGIPLTHRAYGSVVVIVSGHNPPDSPQNRVNWAQIAALQCTVVVLMGLKNLGQIASALVAHGMPANTPAAVISWGTTTKQQTVVGTLDCIAAKAAQAGLRPPCVTIIGGVVVLHEKLNWFEHRTLFGHRIVVVEPGGKSRAVAQALREAGADVIKIRVTRVAPTQQTKLDAAIRRLDTYDWILFSNPAAVEMFFNRFFELQNDLRKLGRIRLGTYGPVTAEKLRELRLEPDAVPTSHTLPLIIEALQSHGNICHQRILLLRGVGAQKPVPEALVRLGAKVDVVECFSMEPDLTDRTGEAAQFARQGADWIIFCSSTDILHFHVRFNLPELIDRFQHMRIALTTPRIRWALEKLGLTAAVVGDPGDPEQFVSAIASRQVPTPPVKDKCRDENAPLYSGQLDAQSMSAFNQPTANQPIHSIQAKYISVGPGKNSTAPFSEQTANTTTPKSP